MIPHRLVLSDREFPSVLGRSASSKSKFFLRPVATKKATGRIRNGGKGSENRRVLRQFPENLLPIYDFRDVVAQL